MHAEAGAGAPVFEVALEGQLRRPEGDLVPRNLVFGEQARLDRFGPGREVGVEQARPVEQVHLADAHDVEQR